jgi:hypothetical protein
MRREQRRKRGLIVGLHPTANDADVGALEHGIALMHELQVELFQMASVAKFRGIADPAIIVNETHGGYDVRLTDRTSALEVMAAFEREFPNHPLHPQNWERVRTATWPAIPVVVLVLDCIGTMAIVAGMPSEGAA